MPTYSNMFLQIHDFEIFDLRFTAYQAVAGYFAPEIIMIY